MKRSDALPSASRSSQIEGRVGCRNFPRLAAEKSAQIGAMPPIGSLYGMEVFVAESLAHNEEIAFPGGSHSEVVRMSYADFERLVQPKVLNFST